MDDWTPKHLRPYAREIAEWKRTMAALRAVWDHRPEHGTVDVKLTFNSGVLGPVRSATTQRRGPGPGRRCVDD